jgi:hypothetical protein
MSASAVRGGQVYVEIGANPSKLMSALTTINTKIADVGMTLESAGLGMAAIGAAIAGPIMAVGGAFVERTAEMENMNRALKDIGNAVGEAVAPAFVGIANVVAGAAKAVANFVRQNQQLIRLAVAVGGYFTVWGTATYALGFAMTTLSRTIAASIGPVSGFLGMVKGAAIAVGAFATSGPVLAAVAVLGGLAAGAAMAGVDFRKLAGVIGNAFANPIGNLKAVFGDLLDTVNLTVEGVYRAIAAGDLTGAVDVLWAGWAAAWARGEQAIMGSLDPWIEAVQNVFSDLGIGMAAMWDQMWTDMATSEWGGYILGAMDNVLNAMMAYWDNTTGLIQKGWTEMWRRIGSISDEAAAKEFARIDAANAANAAQRGRERPGFAGRTGLTDEQKAAMQQESRDRQNAMFAEADRLRKDRAQRTASNVVDRAQAVADANKNLRDQVNRFPVPQAVANPESSMRATSTAQFGAMNLGQLGAGSIPAQQLDTLKKIREDLKAAAMAGQVGV